MFRNKLIVLLLSSMMALGIPAFSSSEAYAAAPEGWQLNGTSWFYFSNGNKSVGWLNWNNKWYFFDPSGNMAHSQWITYNGKQYYLNSGGDMAVNTTVDGWAVGSDGAWDGSPQKVQEAHEKGYVYNPELQLDLKVRSTPDLNGTILGYLYNFERIDILNTVLDKNSNVWDKINFNNSTAYVADAYIQHYDSPPDSVVNIAVSITRQFESASSQAAGNFDGEGLSLGYLQWCIGQQTLQPLLNRMDREYNREFRAIFGSNYDSIHAMLLDTPANQIKWAISINDSTNTIAEPWLAQFTALCSNTHFISIEKDAEAYFIKQAMLICDKYKIKTVRGFALAFDIVVQNGSLNSSAAAKIDAALTENPAMAEKDLLNLIAGAVSESEDTNSRKTAIIAGQGTVHGSMLYLDNNYGLSDNLWR